MRELQGSRELWRLVKELPVNVFDEFARDDVTIKPTHCTIKLKPIPHTRKIHVEVEDDGAGFQNLDDAYTLFRTTPKRGQPGVAGRFNLGEKELMAVALEGGIETTCGTVHFPVDGGRKVYPKRRRERGTRVWAVLKVDGDRDEALEACVEMLMRLIPPEGLRVVLHTPRGDYQLEPLLSPVATARASLPTVLQRIPGGPMEQLWRTTDLVIYAFDDDEAWLYELGCPVQKLACAYSVDVRQKVPMPPERDTVSDTYLKDIYAAVANAMAAQELDFEAVVGDTWIKAALEDATTTTEAVQQIVRARHGDRVALWSSNQEANELAVEAGYALIGLRALSVAERAAYERAGVVHSADIFGRTPAPADYVEPTEAMLRVAKHAKRLASLLLDQEVSVNFYSQAGNSNLADFAPQTYVLSFNVANLPEAWFDKITPDVTGLVLHELAHASSDGQHLPHGKEYIDRLSTLSGQLFHRLFSSFGNVLSGWDYLEYKEIWGFKGIDK